MKHLKRFCLQIKNHTLSQNQLINIGLFLAWGAVGTMVLQTPGQPNRLSYSVLLGVTLMYHLYQAIMD